MSDILKSDSDPLGVILRSRTFLAGALVAAVGAVLAVFYTTDLFGLLADRVPDNICRALTDGWDGCGSSTALATRPLLVVTMLLVLSLVAPFRRRYMALIGSIEAREKSGIWLALAVAGGALALLPYLAIALLGIPAVVIGPAPILGGVGLLFLATAIWLVDPVELLRKLGLPILFITVFMMFLPELTEWLSAALWENDVLQQFTFYVTAEMLYYIVGPDLRAWPDEVVIAVGDFAAEVGHPCAGLAGIAFTTLAMSTYIVAAREDLRIGRVLFVLPLLALTSWLVNALRMVALMLIGAYVSPEVASDGFHSYAGWIAFSIITGGAILIVDRVPFFHKSRAAKTGSRPALEPIFTDPLSARILPFAVFLLTSLLAGALFEVEAVGYPLRVVLTGAVLLMFWRCLPAALDLRPTALAILTGAGIAVVWLVAQLGSPETLADTVPGLTGGVLVFWVVMRLVGTSVLVPIVEELFFRGYLLERLTLPGRHGKIFAVLVSSAIFAVMHQAYILAFLAGVVFAWLVLRTGRLWDVILAHAVANALIGGYALIANDWSVI